MYAKYSNQNRGVLKNRSFGNMVVQLGEVKKSPNDKKSYRAIELPNGLRVVLISDLRDGETEEALDLHNAAESMSEGEDSSGEETSSGEEEGNTDMEEDEKDAKVGGEKLSAAALCIGIGSFSDPQSMPGMAHFLEHMVFMGSEKYPKENEFDAFLQENGGGSNAYTDCDKTVFYFDMTRKNFCQGLDRLANFFVAPLMSKDSIDRELKAIDSEFDIGKNSDGNRKEQLLGSLSSNGHPMGKFMWGNSKSLKIDPESKGVDIYKELKEFYTRNYSSHYMTLAVQSKHNLDTLQKWVIESFGKISNNNLPKPTFLEEVYQNPFKTSSFTCMHRVKSVKIFHQLELTWSLPSYAREYLVKPLEYLSWLIGHESKGSLLSYLKKRTWALSLHAGNGKGGFESNDTSSLFSIGIFLTKEGLKHTDEILSAAFQYLKMLKLTGPNERIYKEIQTLEECNFRFKEETDPSDYVTNLCNNMQTYEVSEYITGEHLLYKYDPDMIQKAALLLNAKNCHIFFSTQEHSKESINLNEKWFGTEYGMEAIRQEQYDQWENCIPDESFHLPNPNEFIPSSFALKEYKDSSNKPIVLSENELLTMRYKKDSTFNVPRAYVCFYLANPMILESPKQTATFDIYLRIIEENLTEIVYDAEMAHLKYYLNRIESGAELKLLGFNDKLQKLFESIINAFANFTVKEDLFVAVKDLVKRNYYNTVIKPQKLNSEVRLSILMKPYWNRVEMRDALESITIDDVLNLSRQFINNLYIEGLVHGNMTPDDALALENVIKTKLNYKPLSSEMRKKLYGSCKSLPEGERVISAENFNENDVISVITNYYQHGPCSGREALINQLLVHLLEEPAFNILRTRMQLGYTVQVIHRVTCGILAVSITVYSQANKFTIEKLNECIEDFLVEFDEMLFSDKGSSMFESQREAMIQWRSCEDTNITEPTCRWWREIVDDTYIFDRRSKEIDELRKIKLEDVRKWYIEHLRSSEKRRKLSVRILGNPTADECKKSGDETQQSLNLNVLESGGAANIEEFSKSLTVYPPSKILI